MFQYAFARILSRAHLLQLRCSAPEQGFPFEWNGLFPNAPLEIEGRQIDSPRAVFETGTTTWTGHTVPIRQILGGGTPCGFTLRGFFQRFEYYEEFLSDVKTWFSIHGPQSRPPEGSRDVLMHLWRSSDVASRGWLLPLDYYDLALERLGAIGRLHLCGEYIDERVIAHFARYRPVVHELHDCDLFHLASSSSRIVLSNSPTMWWAALLSNAREIVAPHSVGGKGYAFTGCQDIDLHMRQERYLQVDVEDFVTGRYRVVSHIVGARPFVFGVDIALERNGLGTVTLPGWRDGLAVVSALTQRPEYDLEELALSMPALGVRAAVRRLADASLVSLKFQGSPN